MLVANELRGAARFDDAERRSIRQQTMKLDERLDSVTQRAGVADEMSDEIVRVPVRRLSDAQAERRISGDGERSGAQSIVPLEVEASFDVIEQSGIDPSGGEQACAIEAGLFDRLGKSPGQ